MWGKFFDSIGGAVDDDTTSVHSGSHASPSALRTPSRQQALRSDSFNVGSPVEIGPGDSASGVGIDDSSEIGGYKGGNASSSAPAPAPIDDGTYVFKFKTPSGRTHRFQARHDMLENLREIVDGKLASDPFFEVVEGRLALDPADYTLSYTDDEGDLIHMTSDGDVTDAVKVARTQKVDRVVLVLAGGKAWQEAIKAQAPPPPTPVMEKTLAALEEEEDVAAVPEEPVAPSLPPVAPITVPEVEEKFSGVDPAIEPALAPPAKVHASTSPAPSAGGKADDGSVAGIPKDLLLPASIGFLGVAVLLALVVTRSSSK